MGALNAAGGRVEAQAGPAGMRRITPPANPPCAAAEASWRDVFQPPTLASRRARPAERAGRHGHG